MTQQDSPAAKIIIPQTIRQNKLCIGLTGGIGSGKSTVAQLFETQGAAIIDTDAIAHRLTQTDGQAIPAILDCFGVDYLNETRALDRAQMRKLIFSDADAKKQLENILHPLILSNCQSQLENEAGAPYLILMAPLLLESPPFLQLVHRVLLVECGVAQQISRVMLRNRLDEKEIRAIIDQQLSSTERITRADDVIYNDKAIKDLEIQVHDLHKHYINIKK